MSRKPRQSVLSGVARAPERLPPLLAEGRRHHIRWSIVGDAVADAGRPEEDSGPVHRHRGGSDPILVSRSTAVGAAVRLFTWSGSTLEDK